MGDEVTMSTKAYNQLANDYADLQRQLQQAQEELRTAHDADVLSIRRLTEERDGWKRQALEERRLQIRCGRQRGKYKAERDAAIERGLRVWDYVAEAVAWAQLGERDAAEQRALAEDLATYAVTLSAGRLYEHQYQCALCSQAGVSPPAIEHSDGCPIHQFTWGKTDGGWRVSLAPAEALQAAEHRSQQSGQKEGG